MERLSFSADAAFTRSEELLVGVTIAPLTAPISSGSSVQAAVFRIASNGGIRRHAAAVPQILAVLEGRGEVAGSDGAFEAVTAGDAVYFAEGEEHETRTVEGLTALVIEGPGLVPFRGERRVT